MSVKNLLKDSIIEAKKLKLISILNTKDRLVSSITLGLRGVLGESLLDLDDVISELLLLELTLEEELLVYESSKKHKKNVKESSRKSNCKDLDELDLSEYDELVLESFRNLKKKDMTEQLEELDLMEGLRSILEDILADEMILELDFDLVLLLESSRKSNRKLDELYELVLELLDGEDDSYSLEALELARYRRYMRLSSRRSNRKLDELELNLELMESLRSILELILDELVYESSRKSNRKLDELELNLELMESLRSILEQDELYELVLELLDGEDDSYSLEALELARYRRYMRLSSRRSNRKLDELELNLDELVYESSRKSNRKLDELELNLDELVYESSRKSNRKLDELELFEAELEDIKALNRKLRKENRQIKKSLETINKHLAESRDVQLKGRYTLKIFEKYNLSKDQKIRIILNFERAQSLRLIKLVYATLMEGLKRDRNSFNTQFNSNPMKSTKSRIKENREYGSNNIDPAIAKIFKRRAGINE